MLIPIPIPSGPPIRSRRGRRAAGSSANIATAALQARIAWSGWSAGAFHIASMPSPL